MIEVKNLHKSYKRGKDVIPNLNLSFADTGLTMIVGKSGCGKTTLLNILGGMDLEYEGKVIVDGKELQQMSYREIVDYRNFETTFVFQISSLFEFLTVEDNLKLCLAIQGGDASVKSALEKVGLAGFEKKKVKALSGGEKQRVGIAKALIKNAKIVFADEPTSALDTKNAHKIFQLFKEIARDRLVILVTHDLKKAALYADRIVQIVDGMPVSDTIYRETPAPALPIPKTKTKKAALLPIFKNHLRIGFVINIFIVLLIMLGVTCFNVALAGKKVKDEYDYYGTQNEPDFNVDRALLTQIRNNIDLFDVVKGSPDDSPFFYLASPEKGNSVLNAADAIILAEELQGYDLYYGSDDPFFPKLVIDTVSPQTTEGREYLGRKCYWKKIGVSNYVYYLYDANNSYKLLNDGISRLPNPDHPEEILVTDVVAWQWICNDYNRIFNKPTDPALIPVTPADIDIFKIIYNKDFVIYDTNGSCKGYYTGPYNKYKVVGIIETGLLAYYDYDGLYFIFKKELKTQDGDRRAEFMKSINYQPFGYVVLQQPLKGSLHDPFPQSSLKVKNLELNGGYGFVDVPLTSFAEFTGDYDITVNPAERYDREKRASPGTHRLYELDGYEDNLRLDKINRLRFLASGLGDKLKENEIIIPEIVASDLFPELDFTVPDKAALSFNAIKNKEIGMRYLAGSNEREIKVKIVGVSQKNIREFYVSESLFQKIYQESFLRARNMTVNLQGVGLKARKSLMRKLHQSGYFLRPIEMMPGAYLEFVPGKGETYAEVDGEGLSALYPDYSLIDIDGVPYFQASGLIFGPVEMNTGENADTVKTVYMKSSTLKKINLDDSYIVRYLGNLSPYYLLSDYYPYNADDRARTLSGNNLMEIITSMYGFLLVLSAIIGLGFIFLRENREKDTMRKLAMLGARPKSIYRMHCLNYLLLGIFIAAGTLLLTFFFTGSVNRLYTYCLPSGATIYRIRLLFAKRAILNSLLFTAAFYVLSVLTSVLVTYFNRK